MRDARTIVSMDPVSLQRFASQTLTPLHFLAVYMWPEHSPKMASTGKLWTGVKRWDHLSEVLPVGGEALLG